MSIIKVGDTSKTVPFTANLSSDHVTRKTGLSATSVYYSLNNGAATAMTTPTVTEPDATNMAGDYNLTVDEAGMVAASGTLLIHINSSDCDHITIAVDIKDNTEKDTYDIVNHADHGNAKLVRSTTPANTLTVDASHNAYADTKLIEAVDATNQINTECDTALSDAGVDDPPTNAEMVARTKLAAEYFDHSTDEVTIGTSNDKTGYALSADGVDAIHDDAMEGTLTHRQADRIVLAAVAGKAAGGGTTEITMRSNADDKDRITATVDDDGNRTAITLDGT